MELRRKSERKYIKPSTRLYFTELQRGLALGWRKSSQTHSSWTARRFDSARYEYHVLGLADDAAVSDGVTVLSYDDAADAARAWHREQAQVESGQASDRPYTVADAGKAWLDAWTGSAAGKRNAAGNLKHHILPTLGAIRLDKLKRTDVQDWLYALANKAPVKQLTENRKQFDLTDPETVRKRRDTANRIFNDVNAMLSLAYVNGKVSSKAAWETVKKFENVGISKNAYLSVDEAKLFINSCAPDFRNLVQAGLATGCRYMELATLKVSGYDPQNHSISLIQGKTQKLKHVFLTTEESAFFADLARGKRANDLILTQANGKPWIKSSQQSRMRTALRAAGIQRHVRFHDLRHTFGTLLAQQGVALGLIANQLGHSSVRVTERYAHFSPEHVAGAIRAAKPALF